MCKFILMIILVFANNTAMAEWTLIGSNPGINISFVDLASIHKEGRIVKMWTLEDLLKPVSNGYFKPYLSMKMQTKYDCNEDQAQTLSLYIYSGNMGSGEVVFNTSNPDIWKPIPPGSIKEGYWKIACGKKMNGR